MLPKDDVEPSETFDWLGMLLLSPGLAAFLYGVSSIPEHGNAMAREVMAPMVLGIVLIVAFVPWALAERNIHPLVELRLFARRPGRDDGPLTRHVVPAHRADRAQSSLCRGNFVPGRWHFGATMCPLGVCGVSRLTIEIGPST